MTDELNAAEYMHKNLTHKKFGKNFQHHFEIPRLHEQIYQSISCVNSVVAVSVLINRPVC